MGQPDDNSINWWAIAHTLSVFGQLSMCVVSVIAFASYRPSSFGNHYTTPDEVNEVATQTTISWVSAAVGAVTTMTNIVLFIALWRAYSFAQKRPATGQMGGFQRGVLLASVVFSLVTAADLVLAIKSGLAGRTDITVVACIS
ncbi:uncharacterized protein F4822DRAFT_385571 [Hypoxylon trugodes]|uniref:uncharacterized protein n=1 Tax=Hypoxylon trugodes TaxID=326681 RepID=UPI002191A15F|nr:uncharacterized protein F4822DRAFT_385571 [Hypoxylon trugodes]KAI1393720.1 hypothetical protein F4822DRAFT_385571 [Hypoxylon trugodes]